MAGQTLTEICSEVSIDNFPVTSEYVEEVALDPLPINETWVATHAIHLAVLCTDRKMYQVGMLW